MTALRSLVIVVVAAALAVALVVDRGERPETALAPPLRAAVPEVDGDASTWFCPGGSVPAGAAEVSLELVNFGAAPALATITGIRSGSGIEPLPFEVSVAPRERLSVPLADHVPDSAWMGAVVEVAAPAVVVEQNYVGAEGSGTDRAPCHTRTSDRWFVPAGATRKASDGEELTLLLLNPFPDDAVVDLTFDADVGVDAVDGVVVPARRVVAVDITSEVTVAARVSTVVDVRAGRLAVSRLQVRNGPDRVGLTVTPAASTAAPVWYLPTLHRAGSDDVIHVTNPSADRRAEVDLEIIADGDTLLDPVELTILPGRTVEVDLAEESRLESLEELSMTARSLGGDAVAVMVESSRSAREAIPTEAAAIGIDAAAMRWLAPVDGAESRIVVVNPGAGIAVAEVIVHDSDGPRTVAEVEIGPRRRSVIRVADLDAADRPLVEISASTPVVVGRDLFGVSSHRMVPGIVAGAAVREAG